MEAMDDAEDATWRANHQVETTEWLESHPSAASCSCGAIWSRPLDDDEAYSLQIWAGNHEFFEGVTRQNEAMMLLVEEQEARDIERGMGGG